MHPRALLLVASLWAVPLVAQDPGPNATPAALRTEYLTNMKEVEEKVITDKAQVIRHVKAAFAYQKTVLEGADAVLNTGKVQSFGEEHTVANLFTVFVADQHEHLGQLIAYARMNGVVPPWSKKG